MFCLALALFALGLADLCWVVAQVFGAETMLPCESMEVGCIGRVFLPRDPCDLLICLQVCLGGRA